MRRRVSIVGGSIAGLSLAAALDPARYEVVIHEAQPQRAEYGGALVVWPSALRALERIGARGVVEAAGSRLTSGGLHTVAGRRLVGVREINVLLAPRPALLAALRSVVPDSVSFRQEQIEDPTALDADLVIGADGVRSRVRGLVHGPSAQRVRTPYVALRGSCGPVPDGVAGEYWGAGVMFGIVPIGPEQGYWFTTHRSELGPEPLDVADVLAEARERFAGAAPFIQSVLSDAGPRTSATRIWMTPPMPRYITGRYAVIGDAAHATTPNLGRGACDAIIDAVTLARAMATGDLAGWQVRRLGVTQPARVVSQAVMRLALLDRGHAVRDGVLGLGRVVSA